MSKTKKMEFRPNDFVVYPAHGVGQIVSIEEQETLVVVPVSVGHYMDQLERLLERHLEETGSQHTAALLQHWSEERGNFIQVCPKEMLNKLEVPLEGLEMAVPAE